MKSYKSIFTFFACVSYLGCFSQGKAFDEFIKSKTYQKPVSYISTVSPGAADVQVSLKTDSAKYPVRTSLFGQNAVAWQGNVNTGNSQHAHYKNANYSLLRYPGGNWSNLFFWDGNLPASVKTDAVVTGVSSLKAGNTSWMLETDEFPDLLNHTGSEGIVCVNVGWAFYGTSTDPVTTAAEYAADWVKYYNDSLNLKVKYWELGNENYGPWQAGYSFANPQKYANACVAFYQAMKAADPSIEIGVVLYEGAGGFNNDPNTKDWNELVLPIVKNHMDFIIIHQYPHPEGNRNEISETNIYKARSSIGHVVETIENQVSTYTGKAKNHYPICITEYNARAGVRELSRTNALFTALFLGEMADHNVGGAMQWSLSNGYDSYGGGHGAVASKDPFAVNGDANPSFYVHYYMDKYFGDTLVPSSSSNSDIVTYGTTFSSGEVGAMLVNTAGQDHTVELELKGASFGSRYYWYVINGDSSDFDRTVYINHQGPGTSFTAGNQYCNSGNCANATTFETNGVGGPQNYSDIKPFSAELTIGKNAVFEVPAHSVLFLVFETSSDQCAIPDLGSNQVLCATTSITLHSGLSATGKSFEWLDEAQNKIGSNNTLVVNQAGNYTVVVDSNGCIASDLITVSSDLESVSHDTLCSAGTAQLQVNGGGNFEWFMDSTGGVAIDTGTMIQPSVAQSEVFYVQKNSNSSSTFGKSSKDGTISSFSEYSSAWKRIKVNAEQNLTFDAVSIFIRSDNSKIILNLYKADGSSLLTSKTYSGLNTGKNRLVLGVDLEKDSIYVLDLVGSDQHAVDWQDDNASDNSLNGLMSFVNLQPWASIKYGFFYDWEISTQTASCARTPVHAVIDPNHENCTVTSNEQLDVNPSSIKVYPNPMREQLSVFVPEQVKNMSIELNNLQGAEIEKHEVNANFFQLPVRHLAPGMYILKVSFLGHYYTKKVLKN